MMLDRESKAMLMLVYAGVEAYRGCKSWNEAVKAKMLEGLL